jgi:hypothetical protein
MSRIIIYFFLLNTAYASDCIIDSGSKVISVKDSERVSLFDSDKSLASHKVQDQDGLGTCYANVTSVLLKSVLPNNPDISYINTALEGSTRGINANWNKNNQRYIKRSGDKVIDVTNLGFTCETINALKTAGGACPASLSILENRTLKNPDVQKRLMLNMGLYFDHFNRAQSNPEEAQKFIEDVKLTIEALNSERLKIIQSCNAEKKLPIPITEGLKNLIGSELLNIRKKPCEEQIKKSFKANLPKSKIGSDRNEIILSDGAKKGFIKLIEANSNLKELLIKLGQGQVISKKESYWVETNLGNTLVKYIHSNLASPEMISCLSNKPSPFSASNFMAHSFLTKMKKQKQINCENNVQNADIISAVSSERVNKCIPPARFEVILNAIAPLLEVGTAIDSGILKRLSNTSADAGNQLKAALAPGCQDYVKLIKVDRLDCKSSLTCPGSDQTELNIDPSTGCGKIMNVKKVFGKKIINAIKQNRAMGISVCTGFMKDPSIDTNFCQKASIGIPGHENHMMTISGYRCVQGKMEYEILNSWGRQSCPVKVPPFKNSAFECVLDSKGRPTGKWWINEDILFKNTNRIDEVYNGNSK